MSGKKRGRDNLDGFIDGLVRVGTKELMTTMDEADARRLMNQIADEVCHQFERVEVYIPVGYSSRNRRIWEAYHSPSATAKACSVERMDQLAAEHGMTRRSLYAIFKVLRDQGARPNGRGQPAPGSREPVLDEAPTV